MALAAAGTEVVSASPLGAPGAPVSTGHYRVDAKLLYVSSATLKKISGGAPSGVFSDEMVGVLEKNANVGLFSFPSVEAADTCLASIVTGSLNPQAASQQRYTVLTLVPDKKASKSGFALRFSSLRPFECVDKDGRPTFDTFQTDVAADSAGGYWCFSIPLATGVYDADGRRSAAIANANEHQLLFVKISRG